MEFIDPYEEIDWSNVEHHLGQFHLHEPRNKLTNDTADHQPDVNVKSIPKNINKNNISPKSSPKRLIEKYRRVGYTVLSITEHEYYVNGSEYSNDRFYEKMKNTSWPWSDWGLTPENVGMIGLQGAELGGELEGLDELHHLISLNNAFGHGRFDSLETVINEVSNRDGIAFLAHPGKYFQPEEWDQYKDLFENTDCLLGMEIFNGSDRYPGRGIWDKLLEHFGSERPIWATGGDDYHTRARETGEKRFNKSRTVLLLSELRKMAVVNALKKGQFYVQYNANSCAPFIESIDINDNTIKIQSSDTEKTKWIADNQIIATGETIRHTSLDGKNYVRAKLSGSGNSTTCTQPIYLE